VQVDLKELDGVKLGLEAGRVALDQKVQLFEKEKKGKEAEWDTMEKQLNQRRADIDETLVTVKVRLWRTGRERYVYRNEMKRMPVSCGVTG
jgi:hypothetical protein